MIFAWEHAGKKGFFYFKHPAKCAQLEELTGGVNLEGE